MLMLASSSSSPRHHGSIERGVDGGNHRVIGGLAEPPAALQADGETRSAYAASSIRRRSAAWPILLVTRRSFSL
jgi:hypothetical protein